MRQNSILLFVLASVLLCSNSCADALALDEALRATYTACVNIDDNLHDLKVLAGVNTAVTSVGSVAGVGATVTGFVKTSKDNRLQEILDVMAQAESQWNKNQSEEELEQQLKQIDNALEVIKQIKNGTTEIPDSIYQEIQDLTSASSKLGNWRTGLLATNAATNIASVAISASTIKKDDFQGQIDACISATKSLNTAILQARINGENVAEAENIYKACTEYEYVDITPIIKRGTGALISSGIGAATGLTGTVVSGVANADKTRNDNSKDGTKKEKDLNTAANMLSVGATVASVSAIVFNATQIAAIKKVASVSEKCTGVLK